MTMLRILPTPKRFPHPLRLTPIYCTVGAEEWVSNLTLHRLPGVSHWVQQEAPEAVNDLLEDWLE